jgi:preprotein translocase subunit SecG
MGILIGCMYVLEIIVCFLLGGVVMLQKPKDGGLNSAIGGGMGEQLFGAQMGNVLTKTTVILGAIFLINSLALSRLTAHHSTSVMEGVKTPAPVAEQQALPTPTAPAAAPATAPAPAPAAAPTAPAAK